MPRYGYDSDEYQRHLQEDDWAAYDRRQQELKAGYNSMLESISADYDKDNRYANRLAYELKVAKAVMCECFAELYMNSIPIDDYMAYRTPLHESATSLIMDEMKNVKNMSEFEARFETASPYIREVVRLAEDVADSKADKIDKADQEFPKEVVFDSDDIKIIDTFEKDNGKTDCAKELRDRVIDVYEAEAELAKKEQEDTQKIVDELAAKNNNSITESIIRTGLGLAETKDTLFKSIFMNCSKKILNESGGGADMSGYEEDVLVETLCTYTLLECVHGLGIKKFDLNEIDQMKVDFKLHA